MDAWIDSFLDPETLSSVTLPTLAIAVAGAVALVVVTVENRSNRRLHRADRIADVFYRLAEVSSEGRRRHAQESHALEDALRRFAASVNALRFGLPRRQRAVASLLRSQVMSAFFSEDTFGFLAACDRAENYFSAWVEGDIPSKKFSEIAPFAAPSPQINDLQGVWFRVLADNEASFDNEGGPAARERWRRTRSYRLMKRRATGRYRIVSRIKHKVWKLLHPKEARMYR